MSQDSAREHTRFPHHTRVFTINARQVKKAHGKTLTKMREGFEANLAELRGRCNARIAALEDGLELRRKVNVARAAGRYRWLQRN